jgi:hypothetical protein
MIDVGLSSCQRTLRQSRESAGVDRDVYQLCSFHGEGEKGGPREGWKEGWRRRGREGRIKGGMEGRVEEEREIAEDQGGMEE